MARGSWLIASAVAVLAGLPAPARAQGKGVRVAIYAPWSGPSTADERHAFALKIEDAINAAEQGAAKVSSFAKLEDFRRAIAAGDVDIAVVDAGATASLGKRLKVVASWSSGTEWVLAGTAKPRSLRNKRLALQAHDAVSSAQLVATLLRGQVSASYWSSIVSAPVTEDARQLVVRGKADVVVVPRRLVADMTEIANLGTFSELAIAATDSSKLTSVTDAVQEAVRVSLGGRWTKGDPMFPKPVAATRLVAAAMSDSALTVLDLLSVPESPLPELALDSLWIDPDAP